MFAIPLVRPTGGFSLRPPVRSIGQVTEDFNDEAQPHNGPSLQAARRAHQQAQQHNAVQARTSSLARLRTDQEAIRRRRENIARFGATWMRPAGVSKTLQAEDEERLEREEQETMARREQMMLDMQAEQDALETRQRAEAAAAAMGADGAAGADGQVMYDADERDLDDEIPDADDDDDDVDDDDEDDDDDDDDESEELQDTDEMDSDEPTADSDEPDHGNLQHTDNTNGRRVDVTFNDDSLLEGSLLADPTAEISDHTIDMQAQQARRYSQLQEAELTGFAQEQMELGMDANLDLSLPEAGEYEHTDIDLEDTTDLDGVFDSASADLPLAGAGSSSFTGRLINQGSSHVQHQVSTLRSSVGSAGGISSFLESSFLGTSPSAGAAAGSGGRRQLYAQPPRGTDRSR